MPEEEMPFRHWQLKKSLAQFYTSKWLIIIIISILAIWMAEPWEVNITQRVADSIFDGSTFVLLAIGLTLVYRILKFANFAHAEFIVFGAYMAFLAFAISRGVGLDIGRDLLFGILIAFILTGLLGIASDKVVFGQLRNRNADAMTIMISSIGVGLLIRHVLQEVYSAEAQYYDTGPPKWIPEFLFPRKIGSYDYLLFEFKVRSTGDFYWQVAYDFKFRWLTAISDSVSQYFPNLSIDHLTLTPVQIFVILCSSFIVLACHLAFTRTKLGKAMRATSDNPDLAQAAGIDTDRVILLVWFLGAGLAGAGGVLAIIYPIGRISPYTGFSLLLIAFAVVILGGIGSFYGAILAAYIMGFAGNFGVLVIEGMGRKYRWISGLLYDWGLPFKIAQILPLTFDYAYKPAIPFAILVIVLIFKPTGIMGLPEEAGKDE